MGSEWVQVPFNDLGEVNRGRSRHRPRYAEHLFGGKYPFIQTGDVRASNGRIVRHTQTYSEDGLAQSRLWPKGTMCITIAANIAETAILTYPACFPDSVVGFVADDSKCDVRFVEYNFRLLKRRLQAEAIGSVQDNINLGTLSRLNINLPSLPEQKAIAHILGSLDDKIELNRQMNETLEAMAQALFKSWFVDFDPVIDNALAAGNAIPDVFAERAKQRKELNNGVDQPHRQKDSDINDLSISENETASLLKSARASLDSAQESSFTSSNNTETEANAINQLFPDAFEYTEELGWIPEGWKLSSIDQEFVVTMGQSPPGSSYNQVGDGVFFYQGSTDFGFRYPSPRIYCNAPKRLASKHDTLVSVRAPVGDTNIAIEECCIGRGLAAIRHKTGSSSFTYYSMLQLKENFKIYEGEGTVFGSINQKDFKSLLQLKVGKSALEFFELNAGCKDKKIELNELEIQNLSKLRDTLLPKLLSGELRIPDAEKLIAEADQNV